VTPELITLQRFIDHLSRTVSNADEKECYRALSRFIDTFDPSDLAEARRYYRCLDDAEESIRAFQIAQMLWRDMPDIVIKQTLVSYFQVG
jgi:hypothetical protein